MKIILSVFFILLVASFAEAGKLNWTNVCSDKSVIYCSDVNRSAYNSTGTKIMKNIKLGKIVGVTWRAKGSIIGYAEAIPSAGISAKTRVSPRNAYYYIIDDGGGDPFVRQCREINAK